MFLKIKADEVRALSSFWAFFDKVLLNDSLKAAVWNQSTFAKFYLRDVSQQVANAHTLGPIVVAQKVVGARKTLSWMLKKTGSLQSAPYIC